MQDPENWQKWVGRAISWNSASGRTSRKKPDIHYIYQTSRFVVGLKKKIISHVCHYKVNGYT